MHVTITLLHVTNYDIELPRYITILNLDAKITTLNLDAKITILVLQATITLLS
jgi:hypothetical protein